MTTAVRVSENLVREARLLSAVDKSVGDRPNRALGAHRQVCRGKP